MSEFVITSAGDRVAYDRRGEGPAVVFVAGAGPFRAIDPETSEVAELLAARGWTTVRSEEHTSELQSRGPLVCRLLLANRKLQIGRRGGQLRKHGGVFK